MPLPDWLVLALGVVILAMIYRDRGNIREAWSNPISAWSTDPKDLDRWHAPSQPVMLMFGLVLGPAAVIYGIYALVT